jgi:hypothetical protein
MSELTIKVSESGISRVSAFVTNVTEANAAGRQTAELALSLSLLDRVAREFGEKHRGSEGVDRVVDPLIFVARGVVSNGVFEQLPLRVARPVQDLRDLSAVPGWFVTAARVVFSNDDAQVFWAEVADDESAAQISVDLLVNARLPWLLNSGWCDTGCYLGVALIAEPDFLYCEDLLSLVDFCSRGNLRFRVLGISWSHPSQRLRIEIFPSSVGLT